MRKKLKEVCDFYSGTGFPVKYQGENDGELPFYKVGDIANNATAGNVYLSLCNNFISHDVAKEIKGTIIPSDVVVFAKIGEALKLNRRAITACDCLIDNNAMGIGGKSEYLNSMYFYFYMKNLKMETLAESTTVPSVRKTKLEEIEIDVPTLAEQGEIVDILAKLQKVINERQEQLEKLDELIKARFVDLFGDPITNPKGWKKEETNKHIDLLSGYPFKSEQYVENGINICGGLIIMPQRIEWDSCVHWPSVQGYEDYLLEDGDIVMALDRPWITEGFKVARVDGNHLPALLIQRTARIRTIDLNQDYLYYCFINGGFDKHSNVTGSLVPHISAKDIRSFEIMIPPIELQDEFSVFMKQVDKSKVVVQKALDEAQLLFDSLMQEYFG